MGGDLKGKAAVVTGGARGIGRAIVERLAAGGADVVFCYRNDDTAAADVVASAGGRAHAVRVDLAAPGAVAELFRAAAGHLDGLDILVNNAAAAFTPAPIAEVTDELYDEIMTVNARVVFQAIRHAAVHMRDGGRIITISTLNTLLRGPDMSLYAGSKGAIEQFTAVAAHELGPRGITANAVSPGATDTDLLHSTNSPEGLADFAAITPLRRIGRPSEVADVVAFLAGPESGWVTGQNIRATGGAG